MNCANIGINNHAVDHTFHFQLSRDLPMLFHESGRGSRQRGKNLTTHLFVDLALYVDIQR